MKKFKYEHDWELNDDVLHSCKASQRFEQIMRMEKKAMEVADRLSFGNYAERLIFMDAFYKGYIAAHCFNDEDIELEKSLTPLGDALK